MRVFHLLCVMTLTFCLTGCGSYKDDVTLICHYPKTVTTDAELQERIAKLLPETRRVVVIAEIRDKVKTSEGKALFEKLLKISPKDRRDLLFAQARSIGLEQCYFETMFPADWGGKAPTSTVQ